MPGIKAKHFPSKRQWTITCPPRNSDFPMALGRRTVFLRYCKTRSCISFSKNKFPWNFRYSDSKLIISSSWSNLNELEMKKKKIIAIVKRSSFLCCSKQKMFLEPIFLTFLLLRKRNLFFLLLRGISHFFQYHEKYHDKNSNYQSVTTIFILAEKWLRS